MKRYKHVVYISHPYGGLEANKKAVENLVVELHKLFPDYLFISPISAFSMLYDNTNYRDGLDMCLWLLPRCDAMWVFGDYESSVGCMSEIVYCQNYRIPYQILNDNCLHKDNNPVKCCECGMAKFDEEWMECTKAELSRVYERVVQDM